ncbi:MAG: DUF1302 family protein, partial [Thermodesulfobacteriota bacterium]|nr:DUF1302 family protein [Thermodesulfobacteriota bacterium]
MHIGTRGLLCLLLLWGIPFIALAADNSNGQQTTTLISTVPVLNIRTKPDLNAAVVGTLTDTETVQAVEFLKNWVYIRKPDGTEGYVFKAYTRQRSTPQSTFAQDAVPRKRPAFQKPEDIPRAVDKEDEPPSDTDMKGTGDPALDKALAGFDDGGAPSDDDLDDTLSGFDDSGGESGGMADALSGFEDDTSSSDFAIADTPASAWDTGGSIKLSTVFNVNHDAPGPGETDQRGLSRMRSEIDLEVERDIYRSWHFRLSGRAIHDFAYTIQGRDQYTGEVLDLYENEAEIREAYVQGSLLPSLDLKTGRQIVVWGRSENFRVTDVLNPMDSRTPGLVDIEDQRLPVCMTKLDYYAGDFTFTGLAIHEVRFNKMPVVGNDFYPLDEPQPDEVVPDP